MQSSALRHMPRLITYWTRGFIFLAALLAPQAGQAQLVEPKPDLLTVTVTEYERAAASTVQPGRRAGQQSPAEHVVWAMLMANALRPEPAYLLEAAAALDKTGDKAEAWMLYGRFLRLRPNTWQREPVEQRMRILTESLAGEMRGEERLQAMIVQQLGVARSAQQSGQLRAAERHYALAYALGDLDAQALAQLARLQRVAGKWNVEYLLWQRLRTELAAASALRSEAEVRLHALTVRPRRAADVYVRVAADLVGSGRQLRVQGGVVDGNGQSSPDCLVQSDWALGLYSAAPCPRYSQPLTGGVGLALQLFPLAARAPLLLRGLGLHLDLQLQPAPSGCGRLAGRAGCAETSGFGQQLRAEAALLWEYRFRDGSESARVQLLAGYGYHSLRLPLVRPDGSWSSLPEPTYHALTVGADFLVPMLARGEVAWSMRFGLRYHAVLESRLQPIDEGRGYGPVSTSHGLRADIVPLRLRLHAGLHLQVGTQLELFLVSLSCRSAQSSCSDLPLGQQQGVASGVSDFRYSGSLGLEYEY